MGRVISIEAPGKIRNQHRRTIAEALRRLSQKPQLDSLHGIADTVDQAIDAWEKRDYYLKAERFREKWRWLEPLTDELSGIVGGNGEARWDELPAVLARLMPHFADVKIKQMTRKPSLWQGAYEKFRQEG